MDAGANVKWAHTFRSLIQISSTRPAKKITVIFFFLLFQDALFRLEFWRLSDFHLLANWSESSYSSLRLKIRSNRPADDARIRLYFNRIRVIALSLSHQRISFDRRIFISTYREVCSSDSSIVQCHVNTGLISSLRIVFDDQVMHFCFFPFLSLASIRSVREQLRLPCRTFLFIFRIVRSIWMMNVVVLDDSNQEKRATSVFACIEFQRNTAKISPTLAEASSAHRYRKIISSRFCRTEKKNRRAECRMPERDSLFFHSLHVLDWGDVNVCACKTFYTRWKWCYNIFSSFFPYCSQVDAMAGES